MSSRLYMAPTRSLSSQRHAVSRSIAWLLLPYQWSEQTLSIVMLLKISVSIGVALSSLIGVLYIVSARIVLDNVTTLEQAAVKQDVQRVLEVLQNDLETLRTEAEDYAMWDDSVAFMQQGDPAFTTSNFNPANLSGLRLNLIVLARPSGQVVFAQGFELTDHEYTPLPNELTAYLTPDSPLLQHPQKKSHAHLLILNQGPMLIAASPILDSNKEGPIHGTLLMGRYIDQTELKRLAAQTQTNLTLWRLDDHRQFLPPDVAIAEATLAGLSEQDVFVRALNPTSVAGYTVLKTVTNTPTLVVRVQGARNLYQQSVLSLRWLLISLIIVGGLTGILIGLLIWRLLKSIIEYDRVEQKAKQEAVLAEAQRIAHLGNWQLDMQPLQLIWSAELFQIMGRSPTTLEPTLDEIKAHVHGEDWPLVEESLNHTIHTGNTYELEHRVVRSDGTVRQVMSRGHAILDSNGQLVQLIGTMLDISERKAVEAKLRASLQEKEVLLKEIHHRVKNNLQMVSSLLDLQTASIQEPTLLEPFLESRRRIKVMALIHESLYRSENLAQIDFAQYIQRLLDDVVSVYPAIASKIQLQTHIESIQLKADIALSCGLIINELVCNAIKHAFPNGRAGEIMISFIQESATNSTGYSGSPQLYTLTIRDNGTGIPEHINIWQTDSLGLQLVYLLTQKLRGTLTLDRVQGSLFKIQFLASE